VMLGYDRIPDMYKSGIPALADKKFDYTDFSFTSIVASTDKRALELIRQTGGQVDGEKVLVKVQSPKPPKLETWDYGTVAERVKASDARWSWKGTWRSNERQPVRTASEKGAEAEIAFEGTGVIVVGPLMPTGGKFDAYLDGKLDRTMDVNSDEDEGRGGESIWHTFGLKPGKHTVKVVVRGEPYGQRQGTDVAVSGLVVFK
ncbi:MAG TPA: hypothetical protein VHA11_11920, partial [Bryobacteraceae bacterium]|nr:hypothetical protein [Bryobacteraceae bacterium]